MGAQLGQCGACSEGGGSQLHQLGETAVGGQRCGCLRGERYGEEGRPWALGRAAVLILCLVSGLWQKAEMLPAMG